MQNIIGFAIPFTCDGNKNMLGADEFILQSFRFSVSCIKQSEDAGGGVHLRCHIIYFRHAFQHVIDLDFHTFDIDFHVAEYLTDDAFLLHQQSI